MRFCGLNEGLHVCRKYIYQCMFWPSNVGVYVAKHMRFLGLNEGPYVCRKYIYQYMYWGITWRCVCSCTYAIMWPEWRSTCVQKIHISIHVLAHKLVYWYIYQYRFWPSNLGVYIDKHMRFWAWLNVYMCAEYTYINTCSGILPGGYYQFVCPE